MHSSNYVIVRGNILMVKLRFAFLVSLLFVINPNINSVVQSELVKSSVIKNPELNPIVHAPSFNTSIEIFNDNDFLNYSLEGNGTSIAPYVIDNFSIETTNITGIYITNTTKYFIIRDGYVEAHEYGIRISDVLENTSQIVNVTCFSNYNGATGNARYETWLNLPEGV